MELDTRNTEGWRGVSKGEELAGCLKLGSPESETRTGMIPHICTPSVPVVRCEMETK